MFLYLKTDNADANEFCNVSFVMIRITNFDHIHLWVRKAIKKSGLTMEFFRLDLIHNFRAHFWCLNIMEFLMKIRGEGGG